MSDRYLAKAAEKIEQWEQACRTQNARYGLGKKDEVTPDEGRQIARAWMELAAIERGIAPAPGDPEGS